ncbi:ABC transporter substrate-binding protein [Rhodococcus sp. NPDC057529]|uniref:ABC transporter substrate-binding protein n=1 Tax=Rhodococcus sp. NPDC057529 TaxID=3346158 RepID=UPI0036725852
MTSNDLVRGPVVSRRTALGLGLGGAVGLFLAACGARPGGGTAAPTVDVSSLNSTDQALLAEAQKEGTVTLYTSSVPGTVDQIVAALDQLKITVIPQRLNSAQLSQRFSAESTAGQSNADVVMISDPVVLPDWTAKGWLSPVDSQPAWAGWPAQFKDTYYSIVGINPQGIAINTNKVDATDAADWNFLLDPEFQGEILSLDLNNVGGVAFQFWDMIRLNCGDDFLTRFAAQQARLIDSGAAGAQQLAAGGASLFVPCSLTNAMDQTNQGAPVKDLVPANAPVTGAEFAATICSRAPHPAAAKFLFNFLMSEQGQKVLNSDTTATSSPNNTPGCPALPARYVRPRYAEAATPAVQQELIRLLGMGM